MQNLRKTLTLLLEIGALTRRDREPMPKGTALSTTLGWYPGPCSPHLTYLQSLTPPFPRTQIRLPKTLLTRLTSKGQQSLISLVFPPFPPSPVPATKGLVRWGSCTPGSLREGTETPETPGRGTITDAAGCDCTKLYGTRRLLPKHSHWKK